MRPGANDAVQHRARHRAAWVEALDEKESLTTAEVDALVDRTRRLLVVSEDGEWFSKHYFDALQRDADAVLAHGEVARLLGPRRPSA